MSAGVAEAGAHERQSRRNGGPLGRVALLAAACVLSAAGCGGGDEEEEPARTGAAPRPPHAEPERRERERERDGDRALPAEPRVETVAEGLDVPWEIAFLPDGRALITERPGRVLLLPEGARGEPRELAEVDVAATGEAGLLGVAIDPQFERNGLVYLYRTREDGNEVSRFRLAGSRLEEEATLVDGIRASPIHDGGRLRFGPDERLYVTTGDAGDPELSQDPQSLNGKVLRLDAGSYRGDGGDAETFTLGHRNPQGIDWQPGSDRLYESEHGPSGDDEVNLLREGENYGWPQVQGTDHGGFRAPLAVYESSIAPSGASFVRRRGSAWTGDFLVAALAGEQIRRLRFEGDELTLNEPLFEGEFGRMRTVVEGPDGALYALTNNTDGRGSPRAGDDRLLRITPPRG